MPEMGFSERLTSDLAGTGLTVGPHPVSLFRQELVARGVRRAAELPGLADGELVRVAGAVICRQRPGTAKGFLFLTLEDETGLVNVIVRPDLFLRERAVLVGAASWRWTACCRGRTASRCGPSRCARPWPGSPPPRPGSFTERPLRRGRSAVRVRNDAIRP